MDGAGAAKGRKRIGDRAVLFALTAMTLVVLLAGLWATRAVNPLRGDSAEYLYFDPSRTVGYPAFLELLRLLTGEVALAVQMQMVLLAASLLFLGWRFHLFVGRPVWTFAFQAFLLLQPGMWFSSAFLMTEALSTALVAIWCAQLLKLPKEPDAGNAASLIAISTLATMVRPSFVALFFGSVIFIILALPHRSLLRALMIAGGGLAAACAATPVAQFLVHGSTKTTSPFARGVLQHTLYCDPHNVPREPDSQLVEQEAAPVRRYIESAPQDAQEQFRRSYSTPLRFGSIIPALGRSHHLDVRSQVDPYLSRIASERLRANPSCYASSALGEYLRMAVFDTDPTSEEGQRINAFMQTHPPVEVPQYPILPGDERLARRAANETGSEISGLNPPRQQLDVVAKVPFFALLPIRLIFGGAALIGLCSLLVWPARRRLAAEFQKIIPATAAMGGAFHANLAITAIVEIGFFRYLVPLWPIVCTLIAMVILAFSKAKGRLRRRGWWVPAPSPERPRVMQ